MEMFDVRTPQGDPTGEVKERSAVHRDGDWHGTAHIWLVRRREGRIELLLQKRSRTKESFPGCYDTSCAGHLSAGDTFLEAALGSLKRSWGLRPLVKSCILQESIPARWMIILEESISLTGKYLRYICTRSR